MSPRAVTRDSLGAWLVKRRPGSRPAGEVVPGGPFVAEACVRPSYRTELIEPGQPVLLWISGGRNDLPAGIHAQGWTTGGVVESGDLVRLAVPVALEPLGRPVLRRELLAHPVLRRSEVLRMPAGSNPSFLTRDQLEELRLQWPQVTAGP